MRGNRACGSLVPKAYLTRGGNWDIPPPHPQLNFPSGDNGRIREEELGRGPGGQQSAVRGRAVLDGELRRRPPKHSASRTTLDNMFWKLPLLLGLLALGPHVCSWMFEDIGKTGQEFSMCVEFAIHHFNEHQPDENAYKLLWVRRSQHKVRVRGVGEGMEVGREEAWGGGETLPVAPPFP